jgi:hypothetical protein
MNLFGNRTMPKMLSSPSSDVIVLSSSSDESDVAGGKRMTAVKQTKAKKEANVKSESFSKLRKLGINVASVVDQGKPARPVLVGVNRNPSGQSTLSFSKKVKTSRKACADFSAEQEGAVQISPNKAPKITSHFKKVTSSSSSEPSAESSSSTKKEVKISIKEGGTTNKVKIRFKGDKTTMTTKSTPPIKKRKKTTARKSFTAEPEVVILSDEEDVTLAEALKQSKEEAEEITTKRKAEETVPIERKRVKLEFVDVAADKSQGEVDNSFDALIHLLKSKLPPAEFDKVRKKMQRRKFTIKSEHASNLRLRDFLDAKRNGIREDFTGDHVYEVITVILDELKRFCNPVAASASDVKKSEAAEVGFASSEPKTKTQESEKITIVKNMGERVKNVPLQITSEQQSPSKITQETSPKATKAKDSPKETMKDSPKESLEADSCKEKAASTAHIRKLRIALKKCHKEIKRLEEAECDWDDDDDDAVDSSYVLCCKYKNKCVQIYKKLAELEKFDGSLGRRSDKVFRFQGSRYPEINSKIEKFINARKAKRQACVPDFRDILGLYTLANKEKMLGMGKEVLKHEAEETFAAVVKKLKSRRMDDDRAVLFSYLPENGTMDDDPAEADGEMKLRLEESSKIASEREKQVIDEFAKKQFETKEQPEEVPDNADEDNDNEEEEEEAEADNDVGIALGEEVDGADVAGELEAPEADMEAAEADGDLNVEQMTNTQILDIVAPGTDSSSEEEDMVLDGDAVVDDGDAAETAAQDVEVYSVPSTSSSSQVGEGDEMYDDVEEEEEMEVSGSRGNIELVPLNEECVELSSNSE